MRNFDDLPISEVVAFAKRNDRAAYAYIVKRYRGIIHGRIKKKSYFLQGGDYEDLFQEGLIGLYKAIRDFNEDLVEPEKKENAFDVFSKICIDRHLVSAIKTSTRKKHIPLNEMISLDRSLKENDNLSMMDIFGARDDVQQTVSYEYLDPSEQLDIDEKLALLKDALDKSLSKKEKIVYELYMENKSYKEIMQDLNVPNPKMVDNAIQRVKRKIDRIRSQDFSAPPSNAKKRG